MDHQTALNSQAVERYLLDELPPSERDEFEEHFFSCNVCTAALQEHEVFSANAKAVAIEDREQAKQAAKAKPLDPLSWWSGIRTRFGVPIWAPALLAVAVCALVVYWKPVQPPVPPADGERAEWALVVDSRTGPSEAHFVPKSAVWLTPHLYLEALDPKRWASYHWELSDASGSVVAQADGKENPLRLNIPASQLDSGKTYILKVWGDRAIDPLPLVSRILIDKK